ncbi:MAG: hypothetical protein HZB50_08395 [Chloroflexi bacterium]|nr:hypothetical protein [Chloroflexota bacterium]
MIVHAPTKTIEDGHVCISAFFEMRTPIPYLPPALWYRFPERYAGRLNSRADAFVPTALLVAMYAGEDLYIHGKISPKLAYHLYEYQEIYHSWDPKLFKKINIQYEDIESPTPYEGEGAVGTAFSGGVDSFYTLWKHLPQNQSIPQAQVTHGLFVHGLDTRLDDEANYKSAAEPYTRMFKELGLELIQASTNAFQFSEFRINWNMFFGTPLIGAALLLGSWMLRFYIPSGMPSYLKLFPQGSSPLIDHLLSTEVTEIVHHGASVSRYDKLSALVEWPLTHHKLRVCSDKTHMNGLNNCSACHKCYRTIALLDLLNALPNYKNFSPKMTPIDYLRWGALTHLNPEIESEIRDKAFMNGRIGMGLWMEIAIILQGIKKFSVDLIKKLLDQEHLFRIKRRVFRPESQGGNKTDDHPPA